MKRDCLSDLLSNDLAHLRYFSLARHALIEALRLADVGRGDHVLLPEFLCREVLASIATLGAIVKWYAVGPNLSPSSPSIAWPHAKVVLAVNYFGFPQNLKPFEEYSAKCGAVIIEDNAHGFLGQDEDGQLLGCRAKLGIFSFRKTIRMPDGAALLINDPDLIRKVNPQLPFVGRGFNRAEAIKTTIKKIPLIGLTLADLATNIVRLVRCLRSRQVVNQTNSLSERELPFDANPWSGIAKVLMSLEKNAEINRRRKTYLKVAEFAAELGIEPVFPDLPQLCVPYGYPFRAKTDKLKIMTEYANKLGLGVMSWPDLPSEIQLYAPTYYRNIKLVNFL